MNHLIAALIALTTLTACNSSNEAQERPGSAVLNRPGPVPSPWPSPHPSPTAITGPMTFPESKIYTLTYEGFTEGYSLRVFRNGQAVSVSFPIHFSGPLEVRKVDFASPATAAPNPFDPATDGICATYRDLASWIASGNLTPQSRDTYVWTARNAYPVPVRLPGLPYANIPAVEQALLKLARRDGFLGDSIMLNEAFYLESWQAKIDGQPGAVYLGLGEPAMALHTQLELLLNGVDWNNPDSLDGQFGLRDLICDLKGAKATLQLELTGKTADQQNHTVILDYRGLKVPSP